MKKIHKAIHKYHILTFMLINILFFSCAKEQQFAIQHQAKQISGEEYFRGLFLFEGEIAKNISIYQPILSLLEKADENAKKRYLDMNNEIIVSIKTLNPSYFDILKMTIESGDMQKIEKILKIGGKLVKLAFLNSSYASIYSNALKSPKAIEFEKYNLETEDGIETLIKDIQKDVAMKNSVNDQAQGRCIYAASVVVVAVYAVALAVEYIGYGVVYLVGAAVEAVWAKTSLWGGGGGSGDQPNPKPNDTNEQTNRNTKTLTQEKFLLEVASLGRDNYHKMQ